MARMSGPHMDAILARHGTPPQVFVETGCFHGKTTRLAVGRFRDVHTIELHRQWYLEACEQLGPLGVVCHFGNSADVLPLLAGQIAEPIFAYLDAHWFKRTQYAVAGKAEGLPLWDELAALATRTYADIVVVDDVHAFGGQEPTPEWADVSLERIAGYFPGHKEALIWQDQAVVYR